MERTYINEVQKEIGSTVKVQGFIENLRNSKYMAFIVLKDITGKLQITVEKEDHPELVDTIDIPVIITIAREDTDISARVAAGAAIMNVSAAADTARIVRQIREAYPDLPMNELTAQAAANGPPDFVDCIVVLSMV